MALSKIQSSSILDGTISASDLATGAAKTNFGAGTVLQVLNTYFGTPQGIGSGSWIDTGLSLTITPSSTNSKILIIANVNGLQTYSASTGVGFQIAKNGTSLIQFGIYFGYPVSMYIPGGQMMYLDSPATTSAITYKVQHQRQLGTGSGVVNGDNSNSFFTLMEIAG